MVEITE